MILFILCIFNIFIFDDWGLAPIPNPQLFLILSIKKKFKPIIMNNEFNKNKINK